MGRLTTRGILQRELGDDDGELGELVVRLGDEGLEVGEGGSVPVLMRKEMRGCRRMMLDCTHEVDVVSIACAAACVDHLLEPIQALSGTRAARDRRQSLLDSL